MENGNRNKTVKVVVLFAFLLAFFLLFIAATSKIALSKRSMPSLVTSSVETAIRGSIISLDGFTLASSKKLYKAVINSYNLDPDKKELFVTLFSIYSGESKKDIYDRLKKEGNIVLSYNIDEKTAVNLKKLSAKLLNFRVFKEYEDESGRVFNHGLSVLESGEKREYLYGDSMEPVIGYVKKYEDNMITKVEGVKGLERYYQANLEPIQDQYIRGTRDIGFNIILNGDSLFRERIDGENLHINISLKLQKKIERVLDSFNQRIKAEEIVASVLDSKSGAILSLATTSRFNPNAIRRKDYPHLNARAIEYPVEPGSVIKPIVFSILLENSLVNPYENVYLEEGRYTLRGKTITDSHKMGRAIAEEVITQSSNIGMTKFAQRLSPASYFEGLVKFGFARSTGVDMPYEKVGSIPSLNMLNSDIYKATVSYGYGMQATFIQVLKAYNVFNNGGVTMSPRVGSYFTSSSSARSFIREPAKENVLSEVSANTMKNILIKTVREGTGKAANLPGLEIGGKTGTAHIAVAGRYENYYNSSFFGFANDKKSKYTIGVMVYGLGSDGEYFASQTATPIFREIVKLLVNEGALSPLE